VRVAVFTGSQSGPPAHRAAAAAFATDLATAGVGVVYGGGHVGLMGIVADAALAAGGEVVGVIPQHLVDDELAHPGLPRLEVVDSMHERKARMVELSAGFIALPGGFGTLDETLEILTWNQLGVVAKPVVFLDIEGYFAGLFDFFDRAVDDKFIRGAHRMLAQRARTVDEAVSIAIAPTPETPHKWIDRDGR